MATFHWFGKGLQHLANGDIDFGADTFKILLTISDYTPNQDTDEFRDDVTNEVAAGGGYTTGGVALAGVDVTYDAASNKVWISWDNPTWADASITARTAVIYKSRGGAASADELIAYATNATDVTSTDGPFSVALGTPTLDINAS